MSTHTQLSFDGFGINDADDYRTRLATFTTHVPDARRKELGALWIAAPAMLEVLKNAIHDGRLQTFEDRERFRTAAREAIRLAEGKG